VSTDVNSFLVSLASAIAAATTPPLVMITAPADAANKGSLFVHRAIEGRTTETYTVLRIYRGDEPGAFARMRLPQVSVQADTRSPDPASALAQAWAVHEALLDGLGRLRMHWAIPPKRMSGAGVIEPDPAGGSWMTWVKLATAPGVVGVDGEQGGRQIVTGNFDLRFERRVA
jgi:hypothetical protein